MISLSIGHAPGRVPLVRSQNVVMIVNAYAGRLSGMCAQSQDLHYSHGSPRSTMHSTLH